MNKELSDHMDNSQGNTGSTGERAPEITSQETASVSIPTVHADTEFCRSLQGKTVWHKLWGTFLGQTTQQGSQSLPLSDQKEAIQKVTQF